MTSVNRNIKRSKPEILFDTFNMLFMVVMCFVMLYPFWYLLIYALNEGRDAQYGGIWFWPRKFTLENFTYVFKYDGFWDAALVSLSRCIVSPVFSITICMMAAFTLSKRQLPGRKALIAYLMAPMFVGGTVVSNYIVMAKLGLINNFLVFVLPGAFGYFTALIMRSFIDDLPIELQESAMLDGANYPTIFVRVIVPLSKPVIAAFLFFSVVGNWLDLGSNLLYITKRGLYTLQYIMYLVVSSTEANRIIDMSSGSVQQQIQSQANRAQQPPTPQVIKMAIIVTVTFPLLFIYPFFQKYFIKGMLTGAVKA